MNLDDPRVTELLGGDLCSDLMAVFRDLDVAEEEIAAARGTDEPDEFDPLYAAFPLLRPTHDLMRTGFVYRAHCRELLDRVAAGEDTRPATDIEIVVNISEASLEAPPNRAATTLMMRLMQRRIPVEFGKLGFDDVDQYERSDGWAADELETNLRRGLRQDWRVLRVAKPQLSLLEAA